MRRSLEQLHGLRRAVILLLALSLTFCSASLLFRPVPARADQAPAFSAERAADYMKYLVQKIGPRPAGSKAEVKAAQYIYYNLEQNGWKVHDEPFSKVVVRDSPLPTGQTKVELVNSQNIIAELPGAKADTVVLGAHYDSADVNAPGALDNASGVGVLLELARVLAKAPHEETYELIFFGAEEAGLVGSSYYASRADLSAVNWMLNLDMVGTPLEIDVAGKKSAPPELVAKITELARKSGIPFHLSRDALIMNRDAPQGGNSDFSSFLEHGIPALGIGMAGRPPGFYHRPEDRVERVPLTELQKVGDFVATLAQSVRLKHTGPRTWDELYLTFQLGPYVFILPSLGLRLFSLLVFLLAGLWFARCLKKGLPGRWIHYLVLLGAVSLTSLVLVAASGAGELLWQVLKRKELVWYAYPGWFLLARLGIAAGLFLFLTGLFTRVPLPREPDVYWLTSAGAVGIAGLLAAFIRIDLAFPFVFWLLCLCIQKVWPNLILAFLGPYFFYRSHWELFHSNQWEGYYSTFHSYALLFIVLYSLLIIPLVLALLHVASFKPKVWRRRLMGLKRPALLFSALTVLLLGLVPSYTAEFPQKLTVREEWRGDQPGQLVLLSPDNLPADLARELRVAQKKRVVLPGLRQEAPMAVTAEVLNKPGSGERTVDLALGFKYARDPYLVKIKLESSRPFKVTAMDEFLPLSKLPRKVQLVGKRSPQGDYALLLERTPPQRNLVKMSLQAESTLKCTVEATFPDPEQSFRIAAKNLSVDYQAVYLRTLEF
ncbi:Peptidase M28 [Acididesulfobacillus acetoxydans]|uniref:M42 glutamyl aminopeptidase protein n=1 Tax=Acididesulfobacillus acetoxydans TaxID=1561005 RepID=A0A8S0Y2W0_9FIRM|nr:M28 family metallopeptidase [Acididesulfobacillus acetoxydans]CAA7601275.1 Peptidase M28 [Acididesulfobacillus acetoxydans]CEJ08815.1 M42 glutamyl aminopeptidase protein [Acididesulfobacillus acetoxydans]